MQNLPLLDFLGKLLNGHEREFLHSYPFLLARTYHV